MPFLSHREQVSLQYYRAYNNSHPFVASYSKSMHLNEITTDTESIATQFSDERSRRKRKVGRGKDESKFKLKKFR